MPSRNYCKPLDRPPVCPAPVWRNMRYNSDVKKRPDEIVFIVEEDESGGFCARAVGHAIFTQGETLDETREMIQDAVLCHFDRSERPRTIRIQP